jgi:carboxypeptidase Taq
MMPPKAAAIRGEQLALISGMVHDLETDKKIGDLLHILEGQEALFDEYEAANIKLAKRQYDRKTKVTKELAEEQARLTSEGYSTWV